MPFQPNLRHLRAFVAVAELGSIARAADSLYRTQSAVTRSIHELESMLEVELFERNVNGMRSTCFGNALLFRSRLALQEFDLALKELVPLRKNAEACLNSSNFSLLFNSRRLLAFVRLGELRHMPTVAQSLGITQPAVSASINELEERLGTPLFKRTSKGVLLTHAGEILSFRAKRALGELRHVESDITALKGVTSGHVVIGALPLSRTTILPRAIAEVIAAYPKLQISTIEGPFSTLAAGLRSGDIDFIVGALRPTEQAKDLVGEPLMSSRMSIVARSGHPMARNETVSTEDLLSARWILSSESTPARTVFDKAFMQISKRPPEDVVETSDLAILRGLLMSTDLVTAISAQQLEYEIKSGDLCVLNFELPDTDRTIGITRRAENNPSPGAKVLMDAVKRISSAMNVGMKGQNGVALRSRQTVTASRADTVRTHALCGAPLMEPY